MRRATGKHVKVGDVLTAVLKRGVAASGGDVARKVASLTVEVIEVGEGWFKFRARSGAIKVGGRDSP